VNLNGPIEAWRVIEAYGLERKRSCDLHGYLEQRFYDLYNHLGRIGAIVIHPVWETVNDIAFSSLRSRDGSPVNVLAGYNPLRDSNFFFRDIRRRFLYYFRVLACQNTSGEEAVTCIRHATWDIYDDPEQRREHVSLFASLLLKQGEAEQETAESIFKRLFIDSILLNTDEVVRFSQLHEWPLVREIPGLTRAVHDSILASTGPVEKASSKSNAKLRVTVNINDLKGRTPQAIFDALKGKYGEPVIAAAIEYCCPDATDTAQGFPFLPGDGSDGRSRREKRKKLLEKAKGNFVIEFIEGDKKGTF